MQKYSLRNYSDKNPSLINEKNKKQISVYSPEILRKLNQLKIV